MRSQFVTVVVPDEASLVGARVATAGSHGSAVMKADGRLGKQIVGVSCFADPSMPRDKIALSESLAGRLGVQSGEQVALESVDARPVRELTLESLTEEASDALWRAVRQDRHLVGQSFWTGDDPDSILLDVADAQFRIRSFDDARPGELRIVTPDTSIELFVQGARIGLDIVVLADVSGSMGVDDLPAQSPERVVSRWLSSTPRYSKRIDALKEALMQMLDSRLRITGRESRMALLCFSNSVTQLFPRDAGMAVVDSRSDRQLIAEFRSAITSLSEYGSTAMAEAILRAAELLDTHGKDDNERLIVLVSDGKPYSPKGNDATGEVVQLRNDEVNLVNHLFRTRGIRLQAIGISDENLYRSWVQRSGQDHDSLRPDHGLIRELAMKGGGDPNRTGGIEVLEDFFQGIGSGYRRFVGCSSAETYARKLSERASRVVRDASAGLSQDERIALLDRFEGDAMALNGACGSICVKDIGEWMPFKIASPFIVARRTLAGLAVEDEKAFESFAKRLHTLMVQQGPGRRRPRDVGNWPNELAEWYGPMVQLTNKINIIRIFSAHDKNLDNPAELPDLDRLHEAMEHFVQRRQIAADDRGGWAQLAAAMLRETAELVHRCAVEATARAQSIGAVANETKRDTETDTVSEFDQSRLGTWQGRVRD